MFMHVYAMFMPCFCHVYAMFLDFSSSFHLSSGTWNSSQTEQPPFPQPQPPPQVPGTVEERQGPRGRRASHGAEGEMAPAGDPGADAQRHAVPIWDIGRTNIYE